MLRVHFTTSFQDCDTRWGSQQRMIHRMLEQENAIRQVLSADRKTTHLIPTWQDTDVFESLDKALSPVAEFTNIMSMEHHVTVSSLRLLLHHLETEVLLQKEDDTQLTANIKKHILMSLQRRYDDEDVSELIDKAGFLDPRFRLEYVSEENRPLIKDCIAREATKILEADDTGDIHVPTQSPDIPPPAKKRKLGSILKKKETNEYCALSTEEKVKKEIDEYLQCPQLDTEADPLQWWKQYGPIYSTLSKLARKYFWICATSEASERLFSVAGNIVTSKRTCLKPDKVNMLTFLAKNL